MPGYYLEQINLLIINKNITILQCKYNSSTPLYKEEISDIFEKKMMMIVIFFISVFFNFSVYRNKLFSQTAPVNSDFDQLNNFS